MITCIDQRGKKKKENAAHLIILYVNFAEAPLQSAFSLISDRISNGQ
jgi:hypothetical protein